MPSAPTMGTRGDRHASPPPPLAPPPPPEERPYHAKRPHRKSRLGCRNCKARKVKCDEAKPTCRNCSLRKDTCNYPAPHGAPSAVQPSSSSGPAAAAAAASPGPDPVQPSSSTSAASTTVRFAYGSPLSVRTAASPARPNQHYYSPGPPIDSSRRGSQGDASNSSGSTELIIVDEPPVKLAGTDEYDMKLLWFYSTETYASFSIEAGRIPFIDKILKSHIITFAFQSPFLMDCILGLSALHMQSLHMSVPLSKAITYRGKHHSPPATAPRSLCFRMFWNLSLQHP